MNSEKKYTKIGGWLWIPAIGLIITPISFIKDSILPLFENHFPMRVFVDYVILAADLILLTFIGLLIWFFFKRKKHTPILFIIFIMFMVLMWDIVDGLHESQNDPPFIAMIVYCLAVIPLFIISKRSHNTFVIDLNRQILIEKIVIPVSTTLERVYLRLRKVKYFIFLIMLIFLFICTLINCALRSLRLDGDILHTFDYL